MDIHINIYLFTLLYIHPHSYAHTYTYVYTYICGNTLMSTHIYTQEVTHIYAHIILTHMHIYVNPHMHTNMHTHMCALIHVYIHVCTNIYIYACAHMCTDHLSFNSNYLCFLQNEKPSLVISLVPFCCCFKSKIDLFLRDQCRSPILTSKRVLPFYSKETNKSHNLPGRQDIWP